MPLSRFHGIVQNVYPLPNDEEEQIRLDEQHFAMTTIQGGNILVKLRRPRKILDVGTGSGNLSESPSSLYPHPPFSVIVKSVASYA